jgi:hypothetical protein
MHRRNILVPRRISVFPAAKAWLLISPLYAAPSASSGQALKGRSSTTLLNIRTLIRMSTQIPAGEPTFMGKQRVHASLRPRRIKNELRLPILL